MVLTESVALDDLGRMNVAGIFSRITPKGDLNERWSQTPCVLFARFADISDRLIVSVRLIDPTDQIVFKVSATVDRAPVLFPGELSDMALNLKLPLNRYGVHRLELLHDDDVLSELSLLRTTMANSLVE